MASQTRPAPGPGRPGGRPRSESSRRAVLEAAYAILEKSGLAAFSIEAVALRSGVARSTIYRWWPTKGALAIESALEEVKREISFPPTGSADSDFRAHVDSVTAAVSGSFGRVIASVLAQAQHDIETQRIYREEFYEPLRRRTMDMLKAGISTGQFRSDVDTSIVVDAFIGAVYFRLLVGLSLDQSWARGLSQTLFEGLEK
jgi:AcrR family transcriptional regulator